MQDMTKEDLARADTMFLDAHQFALLVLCPHQRFVLVHPMINPSCHIGHPLRQRLIGIALLRLLEHELEFILR